jgi:hypothetical protein
MSEVKWREFEVRRKSSFSKNRGWNVISENLKWGEDQLNAVKARELRRDGMWSVCKGSGVEWDVGLGEMCVIE